MHVREAAPDVSLLTVGMCHPLPLERVRDFVHSVDRCFVIEEGDPVLYEQISAAGLVVSRPPQEFRFGEMNVQRVRQLLTGESSPEASGPSPKPPELCKGCSHRQVFSVLSKHELLVSGDIGCYTLAALPPFSAMDSVVCMGASIGVGLGLRHALGSQDGRRVVSVIGDSTFVHSGITGLVEMVYNPPESGHVVIVVDNGTTAMTGQQEHPGTGRSLRRAPTSRLSIEGIATAVGVDRVEVIDPVAESNRFERTLLEMLASEKCCVIVARRACLLARKAARRDTSRATATHVTVGQCQQESE
ncbi:MAG: thiamine pyrophosphate-dependent enzyme [Polyangiaceae bacterium]